MSPFPRPERQPNENESREKPTWPWEETSNDKQIKKRPDGKEEREAKKKAEQSEKDKKEQPKKEEKADKEPEEEKRERRATLLEQSLALVAKYEEEPVPHDATTLAQLIIAHHVVHLNNRLEHPEDDDTPPEEIEATLNYIARLDEKFKNPDITVESEIEQSYQEIMELAETVLAEESGLETIVSNLNRRQNEDHDFQPTSSPSRINPTNYQQTEKQATSEPDFIPDTQSFIGSSTGKYTQNRGINQTPDRDGQKIPNPTQEEFDRRIHAAKETLPAVATAGALIYLITRLGRKKPKQEPESINTHTHPDQLSSYNYDPQLYRYSQQSSMPDQQPSSPIDRPSYATPFQPEHTVTRREHLTIPRRSSPTLAAAAVATTFAATRTRSETSPAPLAPLNRPSSASTTLEFSSFPQKHTPSPENTPTRSDRKIEHMPLIQLLSMAENVNIGQGRYLRHEFESGQIDKEGLVKILKAHSKGRDFQFEFRQQANRFTKLKETSPEFLHQINVANIDEPVDNLSDTAVHTSSKSELDSTTKSDMPADSQPPSFAPPTEHDILSKLVSDIHQPKHTGRRLILITLVALGGLALASLLAITIFNALS